MSFSKIIQNVVDDTITKYVEKVSLKYKIDKQELLNIWNSIDNIEKKEPYDDSKQKIVNSLSRLTKPELVELCKTKNLKAKGTKAELIEILSNDESKKITVKSSENINSKLVAKVPSIAIKRNKFNNFEHEETSFIFDNKEKKVYGKQNSDGSVCPLTKDDINLCNKYKFSYVIPDNLDSKNNDELEELDDDVNLENDEEENVEEDEEEDDLEEVEEEEEEFEEEYDL
jgi:hypothetical protein